MRSLITLSCFFICCNTFAQLPTVLQWQKNFGGSLAEYSSDLKILPDGNFLLLGASQSSNGDIAGNHGPAPTYDICLIKSDPAGNVLWKKSYGGIWEEDAAKILPTADGGFIFVGSSASNDGDVSGHHGNASIGDVWVVKLDASGNIMWQKSYGGSLEDQGSDILEIAGGYIISAVTSSTDGDVSGNHGNDDLWVIKIDIAGNLLWQKCYGGSKNEGSGTINATIDGAFLLTSTTNSKDGDVSGTPIGFNDAWILKISTSGAIIWDKCVGGNKSDVISKVITNNDGSYFLAAYTSSDDLPGAYRNELVYEGDGWVVLLDKNGKLLWQKAFGGTKNDAITDAIKTADGGYLLVGETYSANGIVCQKHLVNDMWLVKMDNAGNIQWNRTYGGSNSEFAGNLALDAAGNCIVLANAYSSNGDLTNNKGSCDLWLTRLSFTGVIIKPSVSISANLDSIRCGGSLVQFTATPVNGGTNPTYQWMINGVKTGTNENPISLNNVFDNDIVSCVLTSNESCLDINTATSNNIKIKVKLPPPSGFLPKDTALCSYQRIELGPKTNSFNSYLWNDGSTSMNIKVKNPGLYWLEVTDRFHCIGRDSITIFPKNCIEGIFVPNTFTPNHDGRNDLFMPFMYVDVKQFKFMVYDRWGRIVFETTTLNKGWDGTYKNIPYNTGVFIWQCIYQLEGEAPTSKRGTVLLLR